MEKTYNNIEASVHGLICDNSECDWSDSSVKLQDYPNWLNKPCPKCGQNVLTEEDYGNTLAILELSHAINKFSPEELETLIDSLKENESNEQTLVEKYNLPKNTERVSIEFNVHKGIHIKNVKPVKNGKK